MERSFFKGFTVYRNGGDPVFVTPHSGPSFEVPTIRDENSDTVASLCWLKTGGTLVMSNMTRKRIWGIDLNRDPPSKEQALEMFPEFMADKNRAKLKEFRSKYAFVAKTAEDYFDRLKIYETFWTTVGNLGSVIILVHRKYARMKNYPSLMDIVTYEGKGVDMETIKGVIAEINRKYGEQLMAMTEDYKATVLLEANRISSRILDVFGEFSQENIDAEYQTWLREDAEMLKKFVEPEMMENLKKGFTQEAFMAAVQAALAKPVIPEITLENFFKGRKALSVKSKFFNKQFLIMEVEVNAFFAGWYPSIAADIIVDIVNMLRGAKLYKNLGIKQTRMQDFL
jgi:hypothetical protein